MPKPIKKRITKKTAIKEEEVKSFAIRALDLIKGRKKHLIIILSIISVLAALFLAIIFYTSSLKEKARSLEMEAYNYYYGINLNGSMTEEERWKKALELYNKSVKTRATPTSLFYLGNSYYNLGDYSNAIKQYNAFIEKFGSEKEILPLVYQKLASAYFKNNQSDKAIETLDALAQLKNGIFKDTSLVLQARYYEIAGETNKAIEKYREIINEFPASPWTSEANAKIAVEDAKLPEGQKNKEDKVQKEPVKPAE